MILNNSYGIVQGRLSIPPNDELQWFPQNCWEKEFVTAKRLGFDFIEVLTERSFNPDNPFWSVKGRQKIKQISRDSGLKIYSSCADYIIDHSIFEDNEHIVKDHLINFLKASADLGCKVVVLPFLEESDLNLKSFPKLVPILKDVASQVSDLELTICIESLLDGSNLKSFLEQVNEPKVKCVFDTGNRIIQKRDLAPEILTLQNWIGHVHIKDKLENGDNVILGTGNVNFNEVFIALKEIDYKGPFVFETTRGKSPQETSKYQIMLCEFFTLEARR